MSKQNTAIIYFKDGRVKTTSYCLFEGLNRDEETGIEYYVFWSPAGSEGIETRYKASELKKIELHVKDQSLQRFNICIMSVNSECNKERGPFDTIEEARRAALKWKGKKDKFLFDYTWAEIYADNKPAPIERITL